MSSYGTNYRCVESLNISVEVAKCGKFSQIHPEHSHLSYSKNDSSRWKNLFKVSFQHIRMSSYPKNKQEMCCVTQHQCRSRLIWKIFTNSPRALTLSVSKNDLSRLNNLFMVSFQLIRISSYAKNKQQMC